jgi:flagellar M-ring protein FliF
MFEQLRQQISTLWGNQSSAQRVAMVSILGSVVILMVFFVVWASNPSFSVAFSGLSESDAGMIVEQLTAQGTPYELRGPGTILVPSDQVYEVRLQMAREGLPEGGTVGYELFSGNMLGMTDFTQRITYQRALEGELERTILSLGAVNEVWVHIVTPEKSLLESDQNPTTASVTVKSSAGRQMDTSQVQAIVHLVSSSVEGLKPENVVLIDVDGNLLASGNAGGDMAATVSQTSSQHAAEELMASQIENQVQNFLADVLGPNESVVQAAVEMDWTEREVSTVVFDNLTPTIRSSQIISEAYATDSDLLGGIPGAVTNLPIPGPAEVISGTEGTVYVRYEDITNYEISETQSLEIGSPGAIERLTLSVLLDGVDEATDLPKLQASIAAAAGIDDTRGDVLVVDTLPFDRTYYETQAEEMSDSARTRQYLLIAQYVGVAILIGLLLWYVQRLLKNLRVATAEVWTPVLQPVSDFSLPDLGGMPSMPEMSMLSEEEAPIPILAEAPSLAPSRPAIMAPTQEDKQMQTVITRMAEENPATVAEIIQMWLGEAEE